MCFCSVLVILIPGDNQKKQLGPHPLKNKPEQQQQQQQNLKQKR